VAVHALQSQARPLGDEARDIKLRDEIVEIVVGCKITLPPRRVATTRPPLGIRPPMERHAAFAAVTGAGEILICL